MGMTSVCRSVLFLVLRQVSSTEARETQQPARKGDAMTVIGSTEWLKDLMNGKGGVEWPLFRPVAQYYPEMDYLLYLTEDRSYRADQADIFLTLLRHPRLDQVIGIKLMGFRLLFERVRLMLELKDGDAMPLAKVLEIASASNTAGTVVSRYSATDIKRMYSVARYVTGEAVFPVSALPAA